MIKFIKSLFCKHDYVYYDKKRRYGNGYYYYEYSFVCKKCETIKKITIREIREVIEHFEEIVNRRKVLNKSIEDLDIIEISFETDSIFREAFKGEHIDLLLKYYSERGIDLTEIGEIR